MSDRALRRTRKCFGYAAVTAVLVSIATVIVGLGELVPVILLGVALAATFGWWWFDHCLEVRRVAASFRDPNSREEHDTEC